MQLGQAQKNIKFNYNISDTKSAVCIRKSR